MAKVWSAVLLGLGGESGITLSSTTGFNPRARYILSCTGPATSVSDGAVLDVSTWLQTKCYGGRIIARTGTPSPDFVHEIVPASSDAPATLKIKTKRTSTGNLISAAAVLTGEKMRVEFIGY